MFNNTKIGKEQIGRPAPLWFRKFKKVFVNLENAALVLLAINHPPDSPLLIKIKIVSSLIIENLETIIGNGQRYQPTDKQIENIKPGDSGQN